MPATRKMNGRINWPATLRRHFVAERRLRIGVAKVGKFRLSFPYFPAILYFNYACANLYNKSRLDCRWLAAEVFTCCGPVGQHKMLSRNRAAEKSGMPGQARHDERVMAANDPGCVETRLRDSCGVQVRGEDNEVVVCRRPQFAMAFRIALLPLILSTRVRL